MVIRQGQSVVGLVAPPPLPLPSNQTKSSSSSLTKPRPADILNSKFQNKKLPLQKFNNRNTGSYIFPFGFRSIASIHRFLWSVFKICLEKMARRRVKKTVKEPAPTTTNQENEPQVEPNQFPSIDQEGMFAHTDSTLSCFLCTVLLSFVK